MPPSTKWGATPEGLGAVLQQPQLPATDPMQNLHDIVDHPLYNAAQMAPGLNMPANALAYASHVNRGQTGEAAWDMAGMIPGVKGIGMGAGAVARGLDAVRDWGHIASRLAMNYPKALARSLRNGHLDSAAVMTGRQAGIAAQAKQGLDAVTGVANAAVGDANAAQPAPPPPPPVTIYTPRNASIGIRG